MPIARIERTRRNYEQPTRMVPVSGDPAKFQERCAHCYVHNMQADTYVCMTCGHVTTPFAIEMSRR